MKHPFDVSGQVIAVTGATGALAGAVAQHLARQGAHVVFLGRSAGKLTAALEACADAPAAAMMAVCDVEDRASLEAARDAVLARFGRIDGLVNGAGGNQPGAVVPPDGSLFAMKVDDYAKVMNLNLTGTLLPSLVFGESMVAERTGAIVNFSSMAASQAITRVLGYSNAKAAVDNLTRWMAVELARKYGDGLRVNAVAPGFFIGEQNRRLLLNEDGTPTERGRLVMNKTPMGRFGEADEVTGVVQFLLSPAARFVTGVVLAVDGGFSAFSGV